MVDNYMSRSLNYTRQKKKKRTTTIFPLRSHFKENVNCHEIFISDQILLKRI